jgi:NACHT domain
MMAQPYIDLAHRIIEVLAFSHLNADRCSPRQACKLSELVMTATGRQVTMPDILNATAHFLLPWDDKGHLINNATGAVVHECKGQLTCCVGREGIYKLASISPNKEPRWWWGQLKEKEADIETWKPYEHLEQVVLAGLVLAESFYWDGFNKNDRVHVQAINDAGDAKLTVQGCSPGGRAMNYAIHYGVALLAARDAAGVGDQTDTCTVLVDFHPNGEDSFSIDTCIKGQYRLKPIIYAPLRGLTDPTREGPYKPCQILLDRLLTRLKGSGGGPGGGRGVSNSDPPSNEGEIEQELIMDENSHASLAAALAAADLVDQIELQQNHGTVHSNIIAFTRDFAMELIYGVAANLQNIYQKTLLSELSVLASDGYEGATLALSALMPKLIKEAIKNYVPLPPAWYVEALGSPNVSKPVDAEALIWTWLHEPQPSGVLVLGESGIGKTTLLHKLLWSFAKQTTDDTSLVLVPCLNLTAEWMPVSDAGASARTLANRWLTQLIGHLDLIDPLDALMSQYRVCFVFDGFSQSMMPHQRNRIRILTDSLIELYRLGVTIIVASLETQFEPNFSSGRSLGQFRKQVGADRLKRVRLTGLDHAQRDIVIERFIECNPRADINSVNACRTWLDGTRAGEELGRIPYWIEIALRVASTGGFTPESHDLQDEPYTYLLKCLLETEAQSASALAWQDVCRRTTRKHV